MPNTVISDQYYDTLDNITDHLLNVREVFGEDSPVYAKMAGSLALNLARIQKLTRDGGALWSAGSFGSGTCLSLGGQTVSGMIFGMVWFPKSGKEAYLSTHPALTDDDKFHIAENSYVFPDVGEWGIHS